MCVCVWGASFFYCCIGRYYFAFGPGRFGKSQTVQLIHPLVLITQITYIIFCENSDEQTIEFQEIKKTYFCQAWWYSQAWWHSQASWHMHCGGKVQDQLDLHSEF